MTRRSLPWILAFVVVSVLFLVMDLGFAFVFRSVANDPQVQMARDVSSAFAENQFTEETLRSSFETFVPSRLEVVLETSLSPWMQIYDSSGKLLHSSVRMKDTGEAPVLAVDLFKDAQKRGEDARTWSPKKNVRHAVVISPFSGLRSGYVVVGRSLDETSVRMRHVHAGMFVGWLSLSALLFLAGAWSFGYLTRK